MVETRRLWVDKTVSISTIAYDGYNLETALKQISQVGSRYVELDAIEGLSEHIKSQDLEDSAFEKRIGTMMRQFRLSSIAFSAHMDLSKEEAVPLFEKKMRFAKSLGAKIINTFSGPLKRINTFYENIKSIDKLAKSMDLIVALETHGDIISDRSSLSVIEKINSENVRINYDFVNSFHSTRGKIDLEKDFEAMLKYIVHLHLKDTRLEKGTWHFTQIGKGIIDYQGIFKILRKSPQKIPMSIELPLRLEMKEGEAPIKTKSPLDIGQINKIVSDSLSYVRRLGNLSDYQS